MPVHHNFSLSQSKERYLDSWSWPRLIPFSPLESQALYDCQYSYGLPNYGKFLWMEVLGNLLERECEECASLAGSPICSITSISHSSAIVGRFRLVAFTGGQAGKDLQKRTSTPVMTTVIECYGVMLLRISTADCVLRWEARNMATCVTCHMK